jgi:hypothetical protein
VGTGSEQGQLAEGLVGGGEWRTGTAPNRSAAAGEACLVCQGTDNLNKGIGWVSDIRVKVHSWHLEEYQLRETIPPKTNRGPA